MKKKKSFIGWYADSFYDGHFTIMKFTTEYKFSFGHQPSCREDIDKMATGKTLREAVNNFLKGDGIQHISEWVKKNEFITG